jgi:hypothetical protein
MKPAIILLTILVVGGAVVWLIDRLFYSHAHDEGNPASEEQDTEAHPSQGCADESCSLRSICPSEQLLAGECREEIIYYDDEELDQYKGREAEDYTDEEAEEFANVFYELKEIEVAGWVRSLQLRQIALPLQLMDEVLLVVRERRFQSVSADGVDHSNEKVKKG